MSTRWRFLTLVAGAALFAVATGGAQDSPSLGDLARQQRQKKEQPKTASSKDAKSSKVVTNEAMAGPAAGTPASVAVAGDGEKPAASSSGAKPSSEDLKAQILAQKNQIAQLQSQISILNASIQFAPAN